MEDKITLDRIKLLHPAVREEVDYIYRAQIVPALNGKAICRFAYTLRTFAEQDALYAQGRTRLFDSNGKKLGIVTKAKGGQSIHNFGLALDIVLIKDTNNDGKFEFKDKPHFEKTFGHTWRTLLPKHNAKDFIPGTNYVKL